MTLFVDTSALYALLDEDDRFHGAAAEVLRSSVGQELETHPYVLVETLALVGHRLGFDAVGRLTGALLPVIDVVMIDGRLHAESLATFSAAGTTSVSFVDRVSFAFMRQRGVDTAFAFDADFASAGFSLVPG